MEHCFHSKDDLQYKHVEPATVCEHNLIEAMCGFYSSYILQTKPINKVFVSKLLNNTYPAYGLTIKNNSSTSTQSELRSNLSVLA
jgi:hypothetical protein